ncbi:MAG: hypothetical protein CSB33_02680 [Desulfobacterales bacterium]|nr:MAG: hypothetical protein CSB33_02680 [Desulfobacterales bacterium]
MKRNCIRRWAAALLCCCSIWLLGACEKQPPPPKKARVIRKKIVFPPWVIARFAGDASSEEAASDEDAAIEVAGAQDGSARPSSGDEADGEIPARVPAAEESAVEDLAKLPADEDFIAYNSKGLLDPFMPLFREEPKAPEKKPEKPASAESAQEKLPPKPIRPLTPLEKLDLSQLKLVGIIRAQSGNKALVEEASGKGYIITRGTYIGINSGRVVEIQPDRVVVEEKWQDYVSGEMKTRTRDLTFKRPPGEIL